MLTATTFTPPAAPVSGTSPTTGPNLPARVRLGPHAGATRGFVDSGWWPRSRDPSPASCPDRWLRCSRPEPCPPRHLHTTSPPGIRPPYADRARAGGHTWRLPQAGPVGDRVRGHRQLPPGRCGRDSPDTDPGIAERALVLAARADDEHRAGDILHRVATAAALKSLNQSGSPSLPGGRPTVATPAPRQRCPFRRGRARVPPARGCGWAFRPTTGRQPSALGRWV